ncbi:MAG TPA: metallophosphoesterase [Phycisphaerae bacterium]|nr:metallophosphoesterase [Phycisphaerae bacterium]
MALRRTSLALVLLVAACLSLAGCGQPVARDSHAVPVAGRVFLDGNANGRFDTGEAGLPGVPVTDGVTFVCTGPDGRYAMAAGRDALVGPGGPPIVSVSFPSGTWPVTGWFRRVDAAADAAAVDFPLRRDAQGVPFVFVHATDPHVPRGGREKFIDFRADMRDLAGVARFCVLTGDLVDLSDSHTFAEGTAEFEYLAEQTKVFPMPLFCTAGNHDAAGVNAKPDAGWDKAHPMYGYGYYRKVVGPLRWSFDYAGVHFVGIDFSHVDAAGKWQWGSPDSAVAWLAQDLAGVKPGSRVFLFVHSPVGQEPKKGAPPESRPHLPPDLLRRYHVTCIFAGHSHRDVAGTYAGIPMTESASLSQIFDDKDRSVGYRLVQVGQLGMDTFYRATGDPHAITLDYPRHKDAIRPGDAICGAFWDPQGEIERLTVKVDDVETEVPFIRGPLWCRFAARPDLAGSKSGPHTLSIAVWAGQQAWRYTGTYPWPKK